MTHPLQRGGNTPSRTPARWGMVAALELLLSACSTRQLMCPPAGMNIYVAAAMFGKPIHYVARAVLPALLAIFLGTLVVSWLPILATGLPALLQGAAR